MEVVSRSPKKRKSWIEVLRRTDGTYSLRVAPSGADAPGRNFDTPEQAMSEGPASTQWLHPFVGMTTNECLVAALLLDQSNQATLAGNRTAAIEPLMQTDVDEGKASRIVDALLHRPPPSR